MGRPALLLDRDGVINVDHGYIGDPADFEVFDGIFDVLRPAADRGVALVVITNQSGIARGFFSQQQYNALESHISALFASHGCPITATYHCPHAPSAGCACRKPKPGLILRATQEQDLDLARSVMVGDKPSDMEAALCAGVAKTQFVDELHNSVDVLARSVSWLLTQAGTSF